MPRKEIVAFLAGLFCGLAACAGGATAPAPVAGGGRATAALTAPEEATTVIQKPPLEVQLLAGEKTKLREKADAKAKALVEIPAGASVSQIGFDGFWLQLLYRADDGKFYVGWAERKYFVPGYQTREYEAQRLEQAIVGFPEEIKMLIRDHRIKTGMTAEMVFLSWGEPEKRLQMQSESGQVEKWIYGRVHLEFKNGRLRKWVVY